MSFNEQALDSPEVTLPPDDLGTSYLQGDPLLPPQHICFSKMQEESEQCFDPQNQTLQLENDRHMRDIKLYHALRRHFYLTASCLLLQSDTGDVAPVSLRSNRFRDSVKDLYWKACLEVSSPRLYSQHENSKARSGCSKPCPDNS